VLPVGTENQYTRQVDIFAFGLATLELATKHKARSANPPQTLTPLCCLLVRCQILVGDFAASGLARQAASAMRPCAAPRAGQGSRSRTWRGSATEAAGCTAPAGAAAAAAVGWFGAAARALRLAPVRREQL